MENKSLYEGILTEDETLIIFKALDKFKYAGVFSVNELKKYVDNNVNAFVNLPKNVYIKICNIMGIKVTNANFEDFYAGKITPEVEKSDDLIAAYDNGYKSLVDKIKENKEIKQTKKFFTNDEVISLATELYKSKMNDYAGEKVAIKPEIKNMLKTTIQKLNDYVEQIEERKLEIAKETRMLNAELKNNPDDADSIIAKKASLAEVKKSLSKIIKTTVKSSVMLNAIADVEMKDAKKELIEHLTPENISSLNEILDSLNENKTGSELAISDALTKVNKLASTTPKKERTVKVEPVEEVIGQGVVSGQPKPRRITDEDLVWDGVSPLGKPNNSETTDNSETQTKKTTVSDEEQNNVENPDELFDYYAEAEQRQRDYEELARENEAKSYYTARNEEPVTPREKPKKPAYTSSNYSDETLDRLFGRTRRTQPKQTEKPIDEPKKSENANATDEAELPKPETKTEEPQVHEYKTRTHGKGRFWSFLGRHWLLAAGVVTALAIGALAIFQTATVGVAAFNLGKFLLYNTGTFCTIFGLSSIGAWAAKYFPGRGKRQASAARAHLINREKKVGERILKSKSLTKESQAIQTRIETLSATFKQGMSARENKKKTKQLDRLKKKMFKLDDKNVNLLNKINNEFVAKEVPPRYAVHKSMGYRIRASFGKATLAEYNEENAKYIRKHEHKNPAKFEALKADGNLVDEMMNFHYQKEAFSSALEAKRKKYEVNDTTNAQKIATSLSKLSHFKEKSMVEGYKNAGIIAKDLYVANPNMDLNVSDTSEKTIYVSTSARPVTGSSDGKGHYTGETTVITAPVKGEIRYYGNNKLKEQMERKVNELRSKQAKIIPTEETNVPAEVNGETAANANEPANTNIPPSMGK